MQSFSGAIINLILIMLMANVYTAVAEWLTKWGKFAMDFLSFFTWRYMCAQGVFEKLRDWVSQCFILFNK